MQRDEAALELFEVELSEVVCNFLEFLFFSPVWLNVLFLVGGLLSSRLQQTGRKTELYATKIVTTH